MTSFQIDVRAVIGVQEFQTRWSRSSALSDYAIAITSKMRLAKLAGDYLLRHLDTLGLLVYRNQGKIRDCLSDGGSFNAGTLPFELVLSIDSFLIQMDSLLDVVKKFIKEFLDCICGSFLSHKEIKAVVKDLEHEKPFYDKLNSMRNFLAHEGSYWPALEAEQEGGTVFSVVLLRKIQDSFMEVSLADVKSILEGMQNIMKALAVRLLDEVRSGQLRDIHGDD